VTLDAPKVINPVTEESAFIDLLVLLVAKLQVVNANRESF
jgi:hypothetical protein